jgi:hypothetical protein
MSTGNRGCLLVRVTGIAEKLWPEQIADRRRHADFVIGRVSDLAEGGQGK